MTMCRGYQPENKMGRTQNTVLRGPRAHLEQVPSAGTASHWHGDHGVSRATTGPSQPQHRVNAGNTEPTVSVRKGVDLLAGMQASGCRSERQLCLTLSATVPPSSGCLLHWKKPNTDQKGECKCQEPLVGMAGIWKRALGAAGRGGVGCKPNEDARP